MTRESASLGRARGAAVALAIAACLGTLAACGDRERPAGSRPADTRPAGTVPKADRATITQILLQYATDLHPEAKRTKVEARALGYALIERVRKGESLEKLLAEYTDDRGSDGKPFNDGVYLLVKGDRALPVVQKAVFAAPAGSLSPDPIDVGVAYLVFRRDE